MKNSTLLPLNACCGFIFTILMILKYGISFISGSFLIWPLAALIYGYIWEKYRGEDKNQLIHIPIGRDEQVNIIIFLIINPVAFLILFSVPVLQFGRLEEVLIVFLPLSVFLFVQMAYFGRLGRMLAHNSATQGESYTISVPI